MKCYGLGLGLDTFRIVSLGENFRRLDPIPLMNTYSRSVPLRHLRHTRLCVTPTDVVCYESVAGASIQLHWEPIVLCCSPRLLLFNAQVVGLHVTG